MRLPMRKFLVMLIALMVIFSFAGNSTANVDEGLVAYYPFDGDADDHKPTGIPIDGSEEGTITYVDGVKRDACYFNDDSSIILGTDVFSDSMQFATKGTVSLWFKSDDKFIIIYRKLKCNYQNIAQN